MNEKAQTSFSSDKHVQVIARPRPLSDSEKSQNSISCLSVNEMRREITVNCRSSATRFFSYDHVFGFQTRQQEVFKTVVAPIIDEVLKGYSSTIFAYGQTGSGKTHTMLGKFPMDKISKDAVAGYMTILESEAGIMPRTIHHIFQGLQRQYVDYTVKITYLELYNEELTDLLADATNEQPEKIKIYEDKDKNNMIVGAVEAAVETPFDAFKVLVKGSQRRQTAETLMNASSSRSHSIFTMMITMKDAQGDMRLGKIHLVDLAGSENISRSGATEKRAREAGTINQSLLTLGRVITALISNEKHICYRDSKLTRILQDSLCGKTITSIIITLSPANEAETLSTLEYGHRARSLKIRPEMNQLSSKDLAREYVEEIRRLRQELDTKREADGVPYSQYLALKNQMAVVQTLSDKNQSKLDDNEQQIEQYRNEIESLRRQLLNQQQEFRSEIHERKELLALNRHRYDELIQLTNKALITRESAMNAIQQLRSIRSSSSMLIDQCVQDYRSIEEHLQINIQRLTDDIQTTLTNFQLSINQIMGLITKIGQDIHILNEKIRSVLSMIFQSFHAIFEEINQLHQHFQGELDRSLSILIDGFLIELRLDHSDDQRFMNQIEENASKTIHRCCEEMIQSLTPLSQSLWQDLHSFFSQSFMRLLNQEFQLDTKHRDDVQTLSLDRIRSKWLDEHEKQIRHIRNDLEQLFIDLIRSLTEKQTDKENERKKAENCSQLQQIRDVCVRHNRDIHQLLDRKLQTIFNQVRDDYDQQCGSLLTTIESDVSQVKTLLNEINNKFDLSQINSSTLISNECLSDLLKQSQRLDVTTKNLEYDWQRVRQSADPFDNEINLIAPTICLPKTDAALKLELGFKDQGFVRAANLENKENFIDGNSLSILPMSQTVRSATQLPVMPCRPKNDTPFF